MSNDEIGQKPKDIDLNNILSESQPGAKETPAAKTESAEPIEATLSEPSSLNAAPRERGRNVLGASFNPNATVPEYIRGTLDQLTGIQKYFHGRDVQRLSRGQVMKITRELFEFQYKDMQHLLTLGMDVQKKTRFLQYMNATKDLQNKIQKESAEAQATVIATMFDNRIEAYKTKNKRDAELSAMLKKGVLDQKQYEQSMRDNDKLTQEQVDRLNETQQMLIIRHTEFLHHTLELFKTDAIDRGII